ncbi:hypothetical protein [Polyangium sp. 15x6]|uniref:TolB family protein n=1 Tax=Polyangium sp. 15x6 TaxID=3042687 RepID=UPI00249C9E52|nr:hypothetical protein [Polyangium sp. 15x6]MDI3283266.1 hypothetical protein [Polyangium sp. 15x6]
MRSSTARARFALSLVALSSLVLGCGGAPAKQSRTSRPKTMLRPTANPKPAATISGPALLPSYVIARLDDENAAPYVARRGEDMLVFYDARGRLLTRLCGPDGKPRTAEPIDVGPAAAEIPVATVEAVGDGYLAAWVEGMKSNAGVKMLSLDATGAARGAPITIAQSADEVSWVQIVAGPKSALVVWEVPREDHFDVLAAPVTPGKNPAPAVVLAHDALGWDLVATERGAAIASVVAGAGSAQKQAEQGRVGRVIYADVDFTGKVSAPVVVNPEATAQNDILVGRAGDRTLIGWTDVRNIDSSVYVAAVAPGGNVVTPPKRATAPVGEQALVSLVSGGGPGKRALLAWEDLLRSPREGRLIHLATMDPDGKLGAERSTLVFSASGPPDITADGDGFAALTLAPASSEPGPLPKDAPIWPTFVRFGPDLQIRAAEPVRAEAFASSEGIPYLTRGLSCQAGACTTLAANEGSPATLAVVGLPVRQSPWRAPASRDPDDTPPRPLSVTALYDGEHLARVAATERPSGGSLAAWVTYYIEGSGDGAGGKPARKDDPLATVGVRPVSAAGVPGKTQILSRRALSIGGVAIAAAPGGKTEESALVWAARDKTEAQVQIAKLGPEGDKLAQKPLTTIARKPSKDGVPSEVSDVAVAYAPPSDPDKSTDDGFIVAWVDTRDGNAEIYAARVDRTLRKVVQDRRITEAPGDSTEVQIAVRGKETFLVWSDARGNPDEGAGDIHVVRLDTRTLQKAGPETRLYTSPGHSRSPTIALAGDRVVVAWIEEAAHDAKPEETEAGVRIAILDERGALAGSSRLVRGEEQSAVTSVALACGPSKCRGVLTSALRDSMNLDAFELSPGAPPGPLKALATLTGGANADVSPSFAGREGTSLFFGDDAIGGTGRVRFMTIGWP